MNENTAFKLCNFILSPSGHKCKLILYFQTDTFLLTKPLFWDSLTSHFFVLKKKKRLGGCGYKGIRGQRALGGKAHNNTHEDSWARSDGLILVVNSATFPASASPRWDLLFVLCVY